MFRIYILLTFILFSASIRAQRDYTWKFLSDSVMKHASVSLYLIDSNTGEVIAKHNEYMSCSQASAMKLVTAAAALEMLGPDYTFSTAIGYSGSIIRGSLTGNIIIKGGGDPSLGSENFTEHYGNVIGMWAGEIRKLGIRKIIGRVVGDGSRYDHNPVPPGWTWEDIGNYYGAGAYGLSVFDNMLKIHFRTGDEDSRPEITGIDPDGSPMEYANYLKSSGSTDRGNVFSAPYSTKGWISGSIPANREDFILKASIPDPPLMAAVLLDKELRETGIKIKFKPATSGTIAEKDKAEFKPVAVIESPPLSSIVKVLNHKSINLYAEHLVKELGMVFTGEGTRESGISIINDFIDSLGIESYGMFIVDGSGLSPQNAISPKDLAELLFLMKKKGKHFDSFYNSIPEAGREGTLKRYFTDPVFESSLRAKSGTLLRVKSFAGYLTTRSGKELAFNIVVNNFTGQSLNVVSGIEKLLKEVILHE